MAVAMARPAFVSGKVNRVPATSEQADRMGQSTTSKGFLVERSVYHRDRIKCTEKFNRHYARACKADVPCTESGKPNCEVSGSDGMSTFSYYILVFTLATDT